MKLGTLFLVHGIGEQKPGYSKEWQKNIFFYLKPQSVDFIEVYWQDVFDKKVLKKKALQQTELYNTLLQIFSKRIEEEKIGPAEWFMDVLLDFIKYLLDKKLRKDIKNRLKIPLIKRNYRKPISIIAHSWGTVVSYDVLIDLYLEGEDFSLDNLLTFGSPLWLLKEADSVLSILHYESAKKLKNIRRWLNVYAKGDPIGASLKSFEIDKDFLVPSIPNIQPHISYFVRENKYVLKNIIAEVLTHSLEI